MKADPTRKQAGDGFNGDPQGWFSAIWRFLRGERIKWSRFWLLLGVAVLVGAAYFVYKTPDILQYVRPQIDRAEDHLWPGETRVAILLPNPTEDGAAYHDGLVQQRGFYRAKEDFLNAHPSLRCDIEERHFLFTRKDELGKSLLETMVSLYRENGVRVFVLTMSSAALGVKPLFGQWRQELLKAGKDLPILVSTVASAPEIADARSGIFRLYIRSTEEAEELAKFAAWKESSREAGIFYISLSGREDDERYGKGGKDTFSQEFVRLGGEVSNYRVTSTGANAAEQVAEFLRTPETQMRCAFVVGYGAMFKATIDALVVNRFQGRILAASTLSVAEWQPSNIGEDGKIVTVRPVRDLSGLKPATEEHNVVWFFSRLTLRKVLECMVHSKSASEFANNWSTPSRIENDLHVEYLADGDTIVEVEIDTTWRQGEH